MEKGKQANYGLLALRIVVGVIFVYMGWSKLGNIEQVAGMLETNGFFWPQLFAYVLAIVEFLGGLAVLFGVYLRVFAKLLTIILVVAILTVHVPGPFQGAFLPLSLLGGTLALMFMGGGDWMVTKKDCCCKMCK